MGIQELIQITYQCRSLLKELPPSTKTISLITRINQQLHQYSQFKHINQSFDYFKNKQSRSKSKKKIFEVFSKQVSPIRTNNILKFSKSQLNSPPSSQSSFVDISLGMSRSQVSQISLNNLRLKTTSKQSNSFQNLQQSTTMVNNSFDNINQNSFEHIKNNFQEKTHKPKHKEEIKQIQFEVEDFFIIDYNFQTKQYEILPNKENYNKKCQFLDDLEISPQKQNEKLHQKISNQSGNKLAVNPFEQILDYGSIKKSQLSNQNSNLSANRYSMLPQLNSNESRGIDYSLPSNQNNIEQIYQIREVIMNLILESSPANHIKEIKVTESMTDLLKLTTNPSSKNKTLQHIVIPSCLEIRTLENQKNCNKYTHVIKTHEGVSHGMKYYECQRFFVIVEKGKKFLHVQKIIQSLIKKAYELRVSADRQVDNVFYGNIKKYIQQISLIPKNKVASFVKRKDINEFQTESTYDNMRMALSDPLYQVSLYCQAAINFQFTLQLSSNQTSKSFQLVLILIYFVIFEYKIIFLTTKGYENLVSEIINTLIHMIGDLRYIYPIIMAMLTNHHIQFVNAPIPGILALWGKQSRCKKAVDFMKRKLKDQAQEFMRSSSTSSQNSNSLPTVVIDMNKHEFIEHSFSHKELFIIQNLQKYIKKPNKSYNFFDKINDFFNSILLSQQLQKIWSEQKWIQILRQRLRKTQMYEEYMKFQQSLKKSTK